MKTLMLNFLGALILLGVNTCTDDPDTVADVTLTMGPVTVGDKTLVDTKWDLQSFEIIDVEESAVGSQGIILIFTKDGRVEGESRTIEGDLSVPGNSYGGVYEAGSDSSLSIEITLTTYVGLPPSSRYEEYIQALRSASAYEIEGNTLHVFYDGRTKALIFKEENTVEDIVNPLPIIIDESLYRAHYDLPQDPFNFESINIKGDLLNIEISYLGSCEQHEFSLIFSENAEYTNPPTMLALLTHDANKDSCKSKVVEGLYFNLALLKELTPVRIAIKDDTSVLYETNSP